MAKDWTDNLLDSWAAIRPGRAMDVYQVTARISRIGLHIARRQEEAFVEFGLNRGDVGVLSALRVAPPPHRLSPTQLLRGLMLSSAGITSRIDRLERRGLVRRVPDENDRRGVKVELTNDGLELLEHAVAANTAGERKLLEGLTAAQVRTLSGLLRAVLQDLEPGLVSKA